MGSSVNYTRNLVFRALAVLAFLGVALPFEARAQNCIDYAEYLRWVGGVDTPGSPNDVAMLGVNACVADGEAGLQIIDVSDPNAPVIVGSVDTPGDALGVAMNGKFAFVADGGHGLQVVYIDRIFPFIVGSVDTPGNALHVAVADSHAYVADGQSGLQVVDVSNPGSPVIVGSLGLNAVDVAVAGGYAYVADANSGLQVVDISDPASPALVRTVAMDAFALAVNGSHAYVVNGDEQLRVVDIADPAFPVIVADVYTPVGWDVASSGSFVYIVGPHGFDYPGFQVFDVSNPADPAALGNIGIRAFAVATDGTHAYLTNGDLEIIDVSNPLRPPSVSCLSGPDYVTGIAVGDSLACVTDYQGMLVADISDPNVPMVLGVISLPDVGEDVAMAGTHAYVADGLAGLLVVDISTPASPVIVGNADTPGQASGVVVRGGYAYVADGTSGLAIVDISNPTSPVIVGSAVTFGSASDVAITGSYAYIVGSRFHVVDVSNPAFPAIVGNAIVAGQRIAVANNHAYVSGAHLQVVDISNPVDPAIVGSAQTPSSVRDVVVAGSHAYVAGEISGLLVFDLTDPSSPAIEGGDGFCFPYSSVGSVAADDSHVYVGQSISGQPRGTSKRGGCVCVMILSLQCSLPIAVEISPSTAPDLSEIILMESSPSPFSSGTPFAEIHFQLAGPRHATLRLFDSSGRLVRQLLDESLEAGGHSVRWDGRNDAGKGVGSGVYYYRLAAGKLSATRAIVRLR